jgi:dimethylargininase
VAIVTRPGAESRRAEVDAVASALTAYRAVVTMTAPATLDGGDVMRIGRQLHVGRSARTNDEGIDQLRALAEPYGYRVIPVHFAGCLHLKSAVTALTDDLLLINPAWVSRASFLDREVVEVAPHEPQAANALRLGDRIVFPVAYPGTLQRLTERGLAVTGVDCSELAKAEGALTCCSLIFESSAQAARRRGVACCTPAPARCAAGHEALPPNALAAEITRGGFQCFGNRRSMRPISFSAASGSSFFSTRSIFSSSRSSLSLDCGEPM